MIVRESAIDIGDLQVVPIRERLSIDTTLLNNRIRLVDSDRASGNVGFSHTVTGDMIIFWFSHIYHCCLVSGICSLVNHAAETRDPCLEKPPKAVGMQGLVHSHIIRH